jgi:hypothetical protein
MDQPVAGNETVAIDDLLIHAEIAGAVTDELVEFLKAAFVEEEVDAFAGGEFTFFVLTLAAFGTTACFGIGMAAAEFVETIGHKRLA